MTAGPPAFGSSWPLCPCPVSRRRRRRAPARRPPPRRGNSAPRRRLATAAAAWVSRDPACATRGLICASSRSHTSPRRGGASSAARKGTSRAMAARAYPSAARPCRQHRPRRRGRRCPPHRAQRHRRRPTCASSARHSWRARRASRTSICVPSTCAPPSSCARTLCRVPAATALSARACATRLAWSSARSFSPTPP